MPATSTLNSPVAQRATTSVATAAGTAAAAIHGDAPGLNEDPNAAPVYDDDVLAVDDSVSYLSTSAGKLVMLSGS